MNYRFKLEMWFKVVEEFVVLWVCWGGIVLFCFLLLLLLGIGDGVVVVGFVI